MDDIHVQQGPLNSKAARIATCYQQVMDTCSDAPQKARRTATLHQLAVEFDVSPRVIYVLARLGSTLLDQQRHATALRFPSEDRARSRARGRVKSGIGTYLD